MAGTRTPAGITRGADEATISGAVEPVVDRALEGVDRMRTEAIAAVDSGREVKRLAACSGAGDGAGQHAGIGQPRQDAG